MRPSWLGGLGGSGLVISFSQTYLLSLWSRAFFSAYRGLGMLIEELGLGLEGTSSLVITQFLKSEFPTAKVCYNMS